MTRHVFVTVSAFALGVVATAAILRTGTAVPAAGSPAARSAPAPERRIKYWRAPMDPTYISDKPGTSPMGMDLIPVYEDEAGTLPPGTVTIDPAFVQNMGVRSEPVRRTDIPFRIRTVGTLAYNDSQVALITTKYDGWIETVHANYVGEPVKKGQDIFDIYSPQLVTTQQEYLQALDYAKRMAASPYPDAAERARALVESARQRLQYWDISDAQIDELARTRQVRRTLDVLSPVNGLIVEKMDQALAGMRATPGMVLYKIVDLSTIWVDVQVFEHQVPWLKIGQRATIELPYEPGRRYTGTVRYLHPSLDQRTRTMTASIELPNPGQRLRADMYATVTIDVPAARHVLAVPENAVIHSGERDVVVIDRGSGVFQARDVTLGVNGSGLWQVTRGLDEGDRVVVSAQFLIDSESNLKAAIADMSAASRTAPAAPDEDR
jgi:Cu(I)/Ag(I) efflux system membrane fusion protein/cobalt-zinc-cadmium efflux system membrane fusion protein